MDVSLGFLMEPSPTSRPYNYILVYFSSVLNFSYAKHTEIEAATKSDDELEDTKKSEGKITAKDDDEKDKKKITFKDKKVYYNVKFTRALIVCYLIV